MLTYSRKDAFDRAVGNNSVCKSCAQMDRKVTVIAIIIPKIPKKFPCLDVSGDESPLKAKMNNTPEIK